MQIKSFFKQNKKRVIVVSAMIGLVVFVLLISWSKSEKIKYKLATVTLGDIRSAIQATGTVQPVETVDVGTQISGRIQELYFDYNSKVEKGQLIALMDSSIYETDRIEAQAVVTSCLSEIEAANVTLENAHLDYKRALILAKEDLIAQSDVDGYRTTYKKALVSVSQAKSKLLQARANLKAAEIKLNYTKIYSPVSGVVIMKNVEKGQTVAASYQTPSIAQIARDLTDMQVEANVDEADIGYIKEGQRAVFDVDSYPEQRFEGVISQLRLSPTTTNNVVTYTVIIKVNNKDKKLLPGMTANINIILQEKDNVKCIPNSAFRFKPQITEIKAAGFGSNSVARGSGLRRGGKAKSSQQDENESGATIYLLVKGKPVPYIVKTGITDGINTELLSDLEVGSNVIVGIDLPVEEK